MAVGPFLAERERDMDGLRDRLLLLIGEHAQEERVPVLMADAVEIAFELERLERIRRALRFGAGDS